MNIKYIKARQVDLAALFDKSQSWVANMQSRKIDPMPRDLDGAKSWGVRLGFLAAESKNLESKNNNATQAPLEFEEMRLKSARADLIELELELKSGRLVRISEVEQREAANAAEFRHVAVEYPLRARAIIERHVLDGQLVDRIVVDLQPLAAELLNKSDPTQLFSKKSKDEIRAELLAHVEKLVGSIA